jgi:hypothetical protein
MLQSRVRLGVGNRLGEGLGKIATLVVAVREVVTACSLNLPWDGLDVLTCGVSSLAHVA